MNICKKLSSVILAMTLLMSLFLIDVSASEIDTLISIAKAEVGTQEDGNDNVKYNNYNGQQWCGWFVSWCAKQAGLSKIIPQFASCSDGYNNKLPDAGGIKHKSKTRGGTYTPQKGDIIFFWKVSSSDSNGIHHVGIVYKVDSTYVYYYDGNNVSKTPHCVADSKRALDSYQIYGYVTPDYSSANNITYAKGDDQSHITIKWAKVTNATTYTLQRRKAGDSSYSNVKTGITSTSYTDSGLSTGQRYYYKVIAYSGSTKLSTSDSIGVYTKFKSPTVTTVSKNKLKISWNSVAKAESYTIMRRTDGEEYDDIKTVTATEYTDTSLSSNTRYYYWIQANCNVDGEEMVAKSTTGQSYTLTETPSISSKSDVTNTSLTLLWNSVLGASSYKVQYRQAGEEWDTSSTSIETTNTSCNIANLEAGKLYWFRIYAVGKGGDSEPSDSKGIYLKPKTPTATATDIDSINISWAYTGGETKFELLARKSGDTDYFILASDIDRTSYTHNGLIPGTQYYYKIKAYNKEHSSIVSGRSDAGYAYTKLSAPTVTSKDSNSISLLWDRGVMDGNYIYTYRICRRISGTSEFAVIATVSEKSYKDTGLQPNTSYDYYIDVLRNDGVWCTNSKGITVTTSVPSVIYPTGIKLSESNISIVKGETYKLNATIFPDNANDKSVSWVSGDSSVASISKDGLITAIKAGNTNIYAKTINGYEAVCNVTIVSNIKVAEFNVDVIESQAVVNFSATNVPVSATIYLVAYNDNDVLLNVKKLTQSDGIIRTIIPYDGVCKLKAFVWDNESIEPLCNVYEYVSNMVSE